MTSAVRDRGYPTSGNGASSFHLWWVDVPPCSEVEVTLTVEWEPKIDRLCFWALQASFGDGRSRTGGAHLGFQWNPKFPRSRAVNWGGYSADGRVLDGTESPLRSTPADRNTRDFTWEPGVPYRLRIAPAERGWWAGIVRDPGGEVVEVRRLHGGGHRLEAPVVWSEVFARCDDESVSVRWEHPRYLLQEGWSAPTHYQVNYQSFERGGCSNTSVRLAGSGVAQVTNTMRTTAHGQQVPVD